MLRGIEITAFEVDTLAELPAQLEVGCLYFVKDVGALILNHGDTTVTYPAERVVDFSKFKGVWPIAAGGTGGITAPLARANLGAMGFQDNAVSASKLATARAVHLNGAVSGAGVFDGTADLNLQTTPSSELELIAHRRTDIRNAGSADDSTYVTERAIRMELDQKASLGQATGAFKGVFTDPSALAIMYPIGQSGWFATVTSTNTTFIWNGSTWIDSGAITPGAVTSVNGMPGPDVVLNAGDVGAYSKAESTQQENDIYTELDTKQDKLSDDVVDALTSSTTPNLANPYATIQDVTSGDTQLQSALATETMNRQQEDSQAAAAINTKVDGINTTLTNDLADANRDILKENKSSLILPVSSVMLTTNVGGTTQFQDSDPGIQGSYPNLTIADMVANKTQFYDAAGTLGVFGGLDGTGMPLIKTLNVSNVTAASPAVLIGNVVSYYSLPTSPQQITDTYGRTPQLGDYMRVERDERSSGATAEYYIVQLGTPVSVLLGVKPNAAENAPSVLLPNVSACLAQGYINPIVGDRYGLYTPITEGGSNWIRFTIQAIDGSGNITWSGQQGWADKDGADIPANYTVRPTVGWGNKLIINTSDYQMKTTAAMSGKVLIGGATPGTFGTAQPYKTHNSEVVQIDLKVPGKFDIDLDPNGPGLLWAFAHDMYRCWGTNFSTVSNNSERLNITAIHARSVVLDSGAVQPFVRFRSWGLDRTWIDIIPAMQMAGDWVYTQGITNMFLQGGGHVGIDMFIGTPGSNRDSEDLLVSISGYFVNNQWF